MLTPDEVRAAALRLDGAVEMPHHGFPSFRAGRIFATLPDPEHLHVMLHEGDIRAAAAEWPWCSEKWWGGKLAAVRVTLADADPEVVDELLRDAHRHAGGGARRGGGQSS